MWDDTNVNLNFKPSRAHNQQLTYSTYYAGNCAKGGVFIQPCGWIGVKCLWVGATSDTQYMEKTGIFERQNLFAEQDLVNGVVLPFTNTLDRGYHVNMIAWSAGRQVVVQPTCTRRSENFSGEDTIRSADVADKRSSNERAVKVEKQSGYIKRGVPAGGSLETMDDVWLAWSFQINFMFKPVL